MFFLLYDFFPSQLWKLQVVSQSCTTTGICLFKVHNETMEQWNKSTLEQRCWQCLYCWYWTDFSNVLVFYQLTVNVLPVNSRFFDKQSIICFLTKGNVQWRSISILSVIETRCSGKLFFEKFLKSLMKREAFVWKHSFRITGLENIKKITWKNQWGSSILVTWRSFTLLKKGLHCRCFPVNFMVFSKTILLWNTSGWIFLCIELHFQW